MIQFRAQHEHLSENVSGSCKLLDTVIFAAGSLPISLEASVGAPDAAAYASLFQATQVFPAQLLPESAKAAARWTCFSNLSIYWTLKSLRQALLTLALQGDC